MLQVNNVNRELKEISATRFFIPFWSISPYPEPQTELQNE